MIQEYNFEQVEGIHQIHYSDLNKQYCYRQLTLYDNANKLTEYFENQVIIELLHKGAHKKYPWFGVISWKFKGKTNNISIQGLNDRLAVSRAQVFSVYRQNQHVINGFWDKLDIYHKGIVAPTLKEAMGMLLEKMGYPDFDLDKPIRKGSLMYCNHVFGTPDYWEQYYPFLKTAFDVVENDPEFKAILMRRCPYHKEKEGRIQRALKRQIGVSYYPAIPFLFERLHTAFLNINPKIEIEHF